LLIVNLQGPHSPSPSFDEGFHLSSSDHSYQPLRESARVYMGSDRARGESDVGDFEKNLIGLPDIATMDHYGRIVAGSG
jgi:hypothetical protein